MSTKEKGAVEANEQRQDVKAPYTEHNFITSALIGQIFRLAAAITTEGVFIYATYLNGKVDLTVIVRGHRYEILNDAEGAEEYLDAIELLEEIQRFEICKGLI